MGKHILHIPMPTSPHVQLTFLFLTIVLLEIAIDNSCLVGTSPYLCPCTCIASCVDYTQDAFTDTYTYQSRGGHHYTRCTDTSTGGSDPVPLRIPRKVGGPLRILQIDQKINYPKSSYQARFSSTVNRSRECTVGDQAIKVRK